MVLPKRPNMSRSRAGVAITTWGENMPTWVSPDDKAAAAEEAPWMKMSWTLLPYFSKSLASLVTQSGANCPTSLVHTTLILAADTDDPWNASQLNKKVSAEATPILFMQFSSTRKGSARVDLSSCLPLYFRCILRFKVEEAA